MRNKNLCYFFAGLLYWLIIELQKFNESLRKTENGLSKGNSQKIENYTYEEKLGQGGYGEVFRATKPG